jgi:hypothetical protein
MKHGVTSIILLAAFRYIEANPLRAKTPKIDLTPFVSMAHMTNLAKHRDMPHADS